MKRDKSGSKEDTIGSKGDKMFRVRHTVDSSYIDTVRISEMYQNIQTFVDKPRYKCNCFGNGWNFKIVAL